MISNVLCNGSHNVTCCAVYKNREHVNDCLIGEPKYWEVVVLSAL